MIYVALVFMAFAHPFKGTTLRADVDGHIQMRAYLTGTPECKFGLNDKLVIDRGTAAGGGCYLGFRRLG